MATSATEPTVALLNTLCWLNKSLFETRITVAGMHQLSQFEICPRLEFRISCSKRWCRLLAGHGVDTFFQSSLFLMRLLLCYWRVPFIWLDPINLQVARPCIAPLRPTPIAFSTYCCEIARPTSTTRRTMARLPWSLLPRWQPRGWWRNSFRARWDTNQAAFRQREND